MNSVKPRRGHNQPILLIGPTVVGDIRQIPEENRADALDMLAGISAKWLKGMLVDCAERICVRKAKQDKEMQIIAAGAIEHIKELRDAYVRQHHLLADAAKQHILPVPSNMPPSPLPGITADDVEKYAKGAFMAKASERFLSRFVNHKRVPGDSYRYSASELAEFLDRCNILRTAIAILDNYRRERCDYVRSPYQIILLKPLAANSIREIDTKSLRGALQDIRDSYGIAIEQHAEQLAREGKTNLGRLETNLGKKRELHALLTRIAENPELLNQPNYELLKALRHASIVFREQRVKFLLSVHDKSLLLVNQVSIRSCSDAINTLEITRAIISEMKRCLDQEKEHGPTR